MTGVERLAVDLAKARLNAALDDAIKEPDNGRQTGDNGERKGVVATPSEQNSEQGRVRFTIRSSNG